MSPVTYHSGNFPPGALDWNQLVPLLNPAATALARFDGVLSAVPNPMMLLSPLTFQEAVLSSRIEGTQATLGEVLELDAGALSDDVDEHRRHDIQEVLNYRRALWLAIDQLDSLPLCGRVIKAAHSVLMEGVRGTHKAPGQYRSTQNWIGPHGCTQETARFVPIAPQQLPEGMAAWERYLHDDTVADPLVQLAIVHAEFEALHPFYDGNGRLGRMLVPLFLVARGLLQRPAFYISAYIEAHRDAYYDHLLAISRDGDWTGWCHYFLEAMIHQAEDNTAKARAIMDLYEAKKAAIVQLTHSQYGILGLDFLFNRPVFKASDFTHQDGIPTPTAQRILRVLRDDGFFRELTPASGRRPAVLAFRELLNIAEGRDVF